jgi:small-conductance mechanosensitive channel
MISQIELLLTSQIDWLIIWWSVLLCIIILGRWLRSRFFPHIYQLTWDTITSLDDAVMLTLCQLGPWFYTTAGIWFASFFIVFPPVITQGISILFTIIVIAQLWQWVIRVGLQLSKEQYFNNQETHNFTLLEIFMKVVFWVIILLLILTNLNIEITPLLASLWVVWIAVSFALQSVLEDLFASVSIYVDKPFRIGDYIATGDNWWTVEHVGIKTTRIRTILWEELVIANRKLTDSVIHNYWKINERTITQNCVVSFNTTWEQQTLIPNLIKEACTFSDIIEFQWCHLIKIWEYGLEYQRRYSLKSNDYNTHLQIQEKVLMNTLASFEKKWVVIERKFNNHYH